MKAVAETLEVARSHLHDKVRHSTKLRGPYRKPDDALMPRWFDAWSTSDRPMAIAGSRL